MSIELFGVSCQKAEQKLSKVKSAHRKLTFWRNIAFKEVDIFQYKWVPCQTACVGIILFWEIAAHNPNPCSVINDIVQCHISIWAKPWLERVDGVNWCAGRAAHMESISWMPIQRTQRRWINAKQVQEQADNVLRCVKPVPTDLSQYFRLVTLLFRITAQWWWEESFSGYLR